MGEQLSVEFYYMLPLINLVAFGLFALVVTLIIKIYEWRNKNGNRNNKSKKKFR